MNMNDFRAEVARNGYTQRALAKAIGMAECTLSRKMQHGDFTLKEADKMISLLKLKNPAAIFFDNSVA